MSTRHTKAIAPAAMRARPTMNVAARSSVQVVRVMSRLLLIGLSP
ncbi:MAG: flagellar biosynthetic protein FliO [Propionibacteriales bacterium]|nr:flagellar biosynthetic protein FliO [Propionibacteriales bacterium]